MACSSTENHTNRIAWMALSSPPSFERLKDELTSLVELEYPFGLVLEVGDILLDRHREGFPQVRRLPGGRARFGTWCRGVAYLFGGSMFEAGARIHLEHARRIWGVDVRIAASGSDARAWLDGRLGSYHGD